jgi:hypothetical protein
LTITIFINFIEFEDSLINGNLTQYRNLIRTLAELNKLEPDSIPKIKKGWFAYVPKTIIDKLLS